MNILSAASKLFTGRRPARVSLRSEPVNVSSSATAADVQAAIRAAEGGDTRLLFALYRDLTVGGSHIQCEFGKRKMAVLSQPDAFLPVDKENADDVKAAEACARMKADCENWLDGITQLLDSSLWPVAVVEKIFRPVTENEDAETPLRFTLRKFHLINPTLLCFRQPYQGTNTQSQTRNSTLETRNSEVWESDLRFYETDEHGNLTYSEGTAYHADPDRHIIHRGHLLVGIRDNWGGPMRSIVFWWLLGTLGRDWFARYMERYGSPFPVGKTDSTNSEAITFLQDAFALSTKIGGLVVDHETQVELIEAMTSGGADAHEKFLSICNREVSKVIIGHTLSAEAQPTGLGSGTSKLQSDVREDIRQFDQIKLGETLRRQLFAPFLKMNGLRGRPPKIVWGGLSDEEAAGVAKLLLDLKNAELEPTDEAIPTISERIGFQIQRKAPPPAPAGPGLFSTSHLAHQTSHLSSGLASGLGVPVSWLAPLRRHLEEIEAKARDKSISDTDLLALLEAGNKRLPELFNSMDIAGLAEVFESGMGAAVIDGVRQGLKKQKAKPD